MMPDQAKGKGGEAKGEVVALMRRMGVKGHPFDPMPPQQHRWEWHQKDQPPLYRLRSWLYGHTIAFHHRYEYAVNDQGQELHLEHAAEDLGMDAANVRRAWSDGLTFGLWRNGTKAEGPRKLFLCGEVRPMGEEKAKRKVCIDLLPPYILKQIKELDPEKQEEFWAGYKADHALEKRVHADLTVAVRLIFDHKDDTRFEAFGIKKIREQHPPHRNANEARARVQPLLPEVERYVQTVTESVETSQNGTYKEAANGSTDSATLLRQNLPEEPRVLAPAGSSDGDSRPSKPLPQDGSKPPKQLPAEPEAVCENDEERKALDLLFREVSAMQAAYKHTDFAREKVSRERKSDQVTLYKILKILGTANVVPFLLYAASEFKGMDRNGLGKAPARPPGHPHGPRSLGLLVTWAERWRAERARGLPS